MLQLTCLLLRCRAQLTETCNSDTEILNISGKIKCSENC